MITNATGNQMNSETVDTAFGMILEAIDEFAGDLKDESDRLFRLRDTKNCAKLNAEALEALGFYNDVVELKGRWNNIFSAEPGAAATSAKSKKREKSGGRAANTSIIVKLPDGRTIKETTAADTFCKALMEMGLERVKRLNKTRNGYPLIGSEKSSENYNQKEYGGYFIMTHTSTRYKKEILEEISKELGSKIEVYVV